MLTREQYNIEAGKILKQYRISANLSQESLGKILGVAAQQIQKYEKGTNAMTAYWIYRLSILFGIGFTHQIQQINTPSAPVHGERKTYEAAKTLRKLPANMQTAFNKVFIQILKDGEATC